MKHFILIIVIILLFQHISAQQTSDLFMQKEVVQAYENGTRSPSGLPGENYWQNYARYSIDAELDTKTRLLKGKEEITYINHSPDTLKVLVFSIYQDIYKKGTSRDWDIGLQDLHDGVNIKFEGIEMDGKHFDISTNQIRRYATTMSLILPQALHPKDSLKVNLNWDFTIAEQRSIRQGTYHKSNFLVAYWFPRIAVYDDILGWNGDPYVGNCEFYNDFCDFSVKLTLPDNYLAWSTGELSNSEDIYAKPLLKKLEKARAQSIIVPVIRDEDWKDGKLFREEGKRTWVFKINGVVDFVFAASDNAYWDATSIQSGNRRVLIHAVYQKNSPDFPEVANLTRNIVDFYTHQTPGYPFPFSQITVFNGRGGMEYPGMVNDGSNKDFNKTIYLTAHEVGHSYFPFYTGLNEQRYAWMDEGLISFFPRKVVEKYTRDKDYNPYEQMISKYTAQAGTSYEYPLMIPSVYTGRAYRYHAYNKPAVAFYELEKYLGTDTFNLALQSFIKRWKGKHPIPWDLFYTFNHIAGEDLAWFWEPWFFKMTYADLSLEKTTKDKIVITNKGGNPIQVILRIKKKDGTIEKLQFPASIWRSGSSDFQFIPKFNYSKVELNLENLVDSDLSNNTWTL
jgi:hypothetical protein